MCSPHSETMPLQSETIFGERLRERELTRHEVSQPETGWGGGASTDGKQGFLFMVQVLSFGLQPYKTAEITRLWSRGTKESGEDGTLKTYLTTDCCQWFP